MQTSDAGAGTPSESDAREERAERDLWMQPYRVWASVRWLTWVVAACGVLGTPSAGQRFLLFLAALWLAVLTSYPRWRTHSPLFLWLERHYLLPVLELAISLGFVALSGGWPSPYYEYALTSVIAPSLVFGLPAAMVAASTFSLGYWCIVLLWGLPPDPLSRSLASTAVNPFMVAYFSALLGRLITRLSREQAEVRRLAARDERYRLSRDLHDGVAQTLFMLSLSLESARDRAASGVDEKLTTRLGDLHLVARQALWETRNAMFDPERLIDPAVPLEEALARLVREWQTVSQIPLHWRHEGGGSSGRLSAAQRVGLYRILQECLANAFKHSGATRVDLTLRSEGADTILEVKDDGRGFVPEISSSSGASSMRGRGMANLRSRAAEIGARLAIVSAPGAGACISLRLPEASVPPARRR